MNAHAISQLVRYAVVGLVSNAVLYLAYLALTQIGLASKLAMTLLYTVGVGQTFFFNKRWTFKHQGAQTPAFVRYCIAHGIGYLLNLVGLFVLVDHFGYPHQIIQGLLILATAVLLFLLQKLWVFNFISAPPSLTGSKL